MEVEGLNDVLGQLDPAQAILEKKQLELEIAKGQVAVLNEVFENVAFVEHASKITEIFRAVGVQVDQNGQVTGANEWQHFSLVKGENGHIKIFRDLEAQDTSVANGQVQSLQARIPALQKKFPHKEFLAFDNLKELFEYLGDATHVAPSEQVDLQRYQERRRELSEKINQLTLELAEQEKQLSGGAQS